MTKLKACKICNTIFEGEKCPRCNSKNFTDSFKGQIMIAKKINLKEKGTFAIKTR